MEPQFLGLLDHFHLLSYLLSVQTCSQIRAVRSADNREPAAFFRGGEVEPFRFVGGAAGGRPAEAARPRPHDRPQGRHLQLRAARQQTRE